MTIIVVGLIVLCCLLLWILWSRIKIDDDETDEEEDFDGIPCGEYYGNGGYLPTTEGTP